MVDLQTYKTFLSLIKTSAAIYLGISFALSFKDLQEKW
jgi:hypothetical protein